MERPDEMTKRRTSSRRQDGLRKAGRFRARKACRQARESLQFSGLPLGPLADLRSARLPEAFLTSLVRPSNRR